MRFALITWCFLLTSVLAKDVPRPVGHVTDLAGMLTRQEISSLENKLKNYENTSSNEVAILIIESLEGEILESYSIKVAQKWGIGQKDKNNGVLLLISKNDRKMRLEIGYGLEGVLTDAMSGRIIDGTITPRFKDGDFYGGISDGVEMIIKVCEGEFTAEDLANETKFMVVFFISIVIVFLISLIGAFNSGAGAITGGFLGIVPGLILGSTPVLIFGIIAGIIVGFIGGIIMRAIAETSGSSGGYSGSSWSSSGSSSSSSFGGGSFGGGGASGSW